MDPAQAVTGADDAVNGLVAGGQAFLAPSSGRQDCNAVVAHVVTLACGRLPAAEGVSDGPGSLRGEPACRKGP
jgi:hypothetical protein